MRPDTATSFVKRAVDVALPAVKDGMKDGDGQTVYDLPGWGVALFAITILAFFVFWVMVSCSLHLHEVAAMHSTVPIASSLT